MNKWNELDQRFYRCRDSRSAKPKAFAREHGLVSAETDDRQGTEFKGRSHSESKNPSANSTRGVSLSSHENTVGADQTRLRG
jgi:hypothetical protein